MRRAIAVILVIFLLCQSGEGQNTGRKTESASPPLVPPVVEPVVPPVIPTPVDPTPDTGIALTITGPATAAVNEVVTLSIQGLPPLDNSKTLAENFAWAIPNAEGETILTIDVSTPIDGRYKMQQSARIPLPLTNPPMSSAEIHFKGESKGLYVIIAAWTTTTSRIAHHRILVGDPGPGPVPGTTLAISATDANKAEGNINSATFTFSVTRSGDTSGTTSVNYAVTGINADASDFVGNVFPSGNITFAANEVTKLIAISVNGDSVAEPDESFTVTLSNPVGATITAATATGFILNDDSAPQPITDIAKYVKALAEAVVTTGTTAEKVADAQKIAANFENVAARHEAAGQPVAPANAIATIEGGVKEIVKLNQAALGARAAAWENFSIKYGEQLSKLEKEDKIDSTIFGRATAYKETAAGLRAAWTTSR